jgi:hypothetical protein
MAPSSQDQEPPENPARFPQVGEFEPEQIVIPLGFLVGAVVGEPRGLDLGRGEPLGHVHRNSCLYQVSEA